MGACGSATPNAAQIDLSHFQEVNTCGQGGFGKVKCMEMISNKKWYAMKRMGKEKILEKKCLPEVWTERKVLALNGEERSPFLCSLHYAFQNEAEVFLIMEYMQGGDLRFQTNERHGKLQENILRFYIAETILGLEALHKRRVIYRDMKPENLLLDLEGHLRISDFGLAYIVEDDAKLPKARCGTPGYMAPELTRRKPYSYAVDMWSLGVTAYELFHDDWPFEEKIWTQDVSDATDEDIVNMYPRPRFDPGLTSHGQDFIARLLTVDPRKRLACGESGWNEAKEHPWFAKIDWDKLARRELEGLIKPNQEMANRDVTTEADDQLLDETPKKLKDHEKQKLFEGWEVNVVLLQEDEEIIAEGQANGASLNKTDQPASPRVPKRKERKE